MNNSADHGKHNSLSDGDLFALLSTRSEYAITCLFDRYSRLVYSTALGVLHDSSTAEDVMQDLFVSLWCKPPTVSARANLVGWFVVAARNHAINLLRRRKPVLAIDDLRMASPYDLSKEAENCVLFNRICGLMKALPVEQQRALKLAFFEGLSHSEIATATGEALGTVKSRIRTALMTLEKQLA